MFTKSNHCVVRVLCIWWTDDSYLTFRRHQGTICYIQPLIPICLLCWHRNHQRSLQFLIRMVPGQKPKWILPHYQHPMRRRTTLVWLVTCLTVLLKYSGGKQVRYLYCHDCIVQKHFKSFFGCCVDPNRYYYCKGQLWSWLLSLGIQGLMSWGNCSLIFCMGSRAGWIRLFRHAGMGTNDNS